MFIDNKYYKWYMKLTQNKVEKEGYTEKHHIVPRSMGGTDDKENLVILTAREHYIAHLLLTKCVSEEFLSKMLYAYMMMSIVKDENQDRTFKVNARLFESRKLESIEFKKAYKHTEEAKKSISKNLKGVKKKPFTKEHKINISEGHKGQKAWNKGIKGVVTASEETKRKMSESANGRIVKDSTKKKLSDISKGKITCYDKTIGKAIKIDSEEYHNGKGVRYITMRSNEYKLNYKELLNA